MGPVSLRSRIEAMEDWLDAWTARPIKGPRLAKKIAYVFQLDAEAILDEWRACPPTWPFFERIDLLRFHEEFAAAHGMSDTANRGVYERQRECDLWGFQERARKSLGS